MRFNLLGPLEAVRDGRPVPLGGANQRAALGFLLLHAGAVVSTGDLIRALWDDPPPPTARKMVQNAVAGVRRALPAGGSAALLTAPPGYLLRVDPDRIDATRFHALVERGRADFRAEAWEPAARRLREALALWRGPALADVAEAGAAWPELTVLEEARFAALEDCLEAELALGRHHELIGEMTSLADEDPVRERLCGLLMLAFYRAGRQRDALAAYQRLRGLLRDGFGLDPAPALRELERDILNQHPRLTLRPAPARPGTGGASIRAACAGSAAPPARTPAARTGGAPARVPDARADSPARPLAERKRASVLLVRTRVDVLHGDSECVDEALDDLARVIAEEARRFGGAVRETLGSVRPVVYGFPHSHEDDPERAARTALAVRERVDGRVLDFLGVQIAIATGEILATYRDERDPVPAQLSGTVPHTAERLLAHTRPGTVRVCHATARAVGMPPLPLGDCPSAGDVPAECGRELVLPAPAPAAPDGAPLLGRERELEVLRGVLGDVHRRQRPHLVTVFGEPGLGKSRLVAEFAAGVPGPVLFGRVPRHGGGDLALLAGALRSRPDGAEAARRIERLPVEAGAAAWRRHVADLAMDGPVTVVLEDVHRAGAALQDQVEDLTEQLPEVPLLVVVTARPELRRRAVPWGCGRRDVSELALDPLPEDATRALLPASADPTLLMLVGGNPRHAEEYARAVRGHAGDAYDGAYDGAPVPGPLRALVAARIDTLALPERAVLRDATVFQRLGFRAEGVAALSGRPAAETAAVLRDLERQGFLARRPVGDGGEPGYAFRQPIVREVAHAQIPRARRIAKHRRAIEWIGTLPPAEAGLLVHHYRLLVVLNSPRLAYDTSRQAHHALLAAERRAAAAGAHEVAARCRHAALELRRGRSRPTPAWAAFHRPLPRRADDPTLAAYT
ncbi:BTAD domain-containing putative transcriptional regulator [Actinomadura parmotrematis]|uniref:AAA family ATPase n=1 Tax=Actinomadura parmotrematis TaxID=2864039 RepID=A0ABS7FNW3_9ACTN|nr:BTAD domain-containing putative transcriptional regulator [Actinomadura parmotrematis]MBW8481268.1 AAA family ATPase [Actinomadura parmotrematis]